MSNAARPRVMGGVSSGRRRSTLLVMISALLAAGIMAVSCNKDGYIYDDPEASGLPPVIELDSETGIYTAKVGRELVIAPAFAYADHATVEWREEGRLLSAERSLRIIWDEAGTHYITLSAGNRYGTVSEELRVDVGELLIPSISLPFAGDEVTVLTGAPFVVTPEVANADVDDFEIRWTVDGTEAGGELTFSFVSESEGDFEICVATSNADGSDSRRFVIRVCGTLPYELAFPPISCFNTSTDRYTFPGRGVMLAPAMGNLKCETIVWSVDGVTVDCSDRTMLFTPATAGEYTVNVLVDNMASAGMRVVCVDAVESDRFRKARAGDSASSNEVYEWVPAPGQFIGETQTGGMTGNETTHEQAKAWAKGRLAGRQYVSLGAFGGYIVVGFDHSIEAGGGSGYDFAIQGNAFFNASNGKGGSNEPGIVYVMQDVNGNGLPDDEWFELCGSETGKPTTLHDYAVTYYRPAAPRMAVQWRDNRGASGTIDYLAAFHRQDYYYPAWIESDSYTLRGTRLEARTTQDGSTGLWDNWAFDWGYADNMGSDNIAVGDAGGEGQSVGFRISNAIYPDGSAVSLRYIDFIKVQTGVNSKSGWLGEVSTEVVGFEDLNLK